jgi:hypothetical protein
MLVFQVEGNVVLICPLSGLRQTSSDGILGLACVVCRRWLTTIDHVQDWGATLMLFATSMGGDRRRAWVRDGHGWISPSYYS